MVSPVVLSAHEGGSAAGLLSGLTHPISGLDHVLAMVAVGIWGAQLGQPAVWLLPVTFPVVMALGGMLGLLGMPLPGVEVGIGLSALLLGLVVATERRLGLRLAAVWSAPSRCSMGMPTVWSFRRGRAASCIRLGSWARRAPCTPPVSPSA